MTVGADAVLRAWFGEDLEDPRAVSERAKRWFSIDPAFDEAIRSRFSSFPDRALDGELEAWRQAARSALALVLVLDQFPRNLYRGTARSFAYDAAAVDLSCWALEQRFDARLHPLEAVFLYLPFEHSEDRARQRRSVSLFRDLIERAPSQLSSQFESFLAYAERHRAVIERFGRFPHRNAVLGRRSTSEEREYLRSGGETFSGAEGTA